MSPPRRGAGGAGAEPPRRDFYSDFAAKPLIFEAILPFGDPPDCARVAARTGSRQRSATDSSGQLQGAHEMCRKCFHKVEFEDSAKMTDTIMTLRGRD